MNRFATVLAPTLSVILVNVSAHAQATILDYIPQSRETILNTDFTQVTPFGAQPINVAGGVFFFRNVTIPAGRTVRGVGSNPMVWIVTGDFTVDGTLTVDGGDGDRTNTLNSANFPTPGGFPGCTSGAGGAGSPNTTDRSFVGQTGFGAFNVPLRGGRGGRLLCGPLPGSGSGGGGGVFATAGDPFYLPPGGLVIQQFGIGGPGQNGTLPGGVPGNSVFTDTDPANDFLGIGIDLNLGRVIFGELTAFRGGQGGGGGGDKSLRCTTADPMFINDSKGGGGGAGGGSLIIFALNRIVIGPQGLISANGGNGGGGEQAGSNNQGGGGGAGSGGMIVCGALQGIEIHTHGDTYGNGDYQFALSADGGISTQTGFGGATAINGKYPPPPASAFNRASGGMGGMGLVQLMVPPGTTNADGTNTILDDNITIVGNGGPLTGAQKQRYIAWRGWPDANGAMVDDFGQPTNIGSNEGDIRPAPKLLPLF